MPKHILLLFTIVVSAVGYQANAAPTIEEIIKQGGEITEERLAGYKEMDCGQIKAEFTYVAGRYEYGATPRMISGTFFVGGDIRYLFAIKELTKVANEKRCEIRAIECSNYPLTCEALTSYQ